MLIFNWTGSAFAWWSDCLATWPTVQSLVMDVPRALLEQVLTSLMPGFRLIACRPLSRRASELDLAAPDQARRQLMLLQHSLRDRQRIPQIARNEYALLQILWEADLPVPRPLHLSSIPDNPFLVTEYVDGEIRFTTDDLAGFCDMLAGTLFAIHSLDLKRHDLAFLPTQDGLLRETLRQASCDALGIRAAISAALPDIKKNSSTLLHGDFWLGNLLWRGDQPAAIIDWEDAMLGDPLGDVGKCRLETRWALGEEAMELFTASYFARSSQLDPGALPFWDLWGALRLPHFASWTDDKQRIRNMQSQYRAFVKAARHALQAAQK